MEVSAYEKNYIVLHDLQKPDHSLPGLMIKLSRRQNMISQTPNTLIIIMGKSPCDDITERKFKLDLVFT